MRVRDVMRTVPVCCAEQPALAAIRHVTLQNRAGFVVDGPGTQPPVLLSQLELLALTLPHYLHASHALAAL